ncbi:MAG: DNA polymerase Y family protein [Acidimicrobiia bacterium]
MPPNARQKGSATRTCVVWCPDWMVVARRRAQPELVDEPVAVLDRVDGREIVVCASADAREHEVVVGLRRREAEARCPGLVFVAADPTVDAQAFEGVARAVEAITPRVELQEPGWLAFPTIGPSRYFGGDDALAQKVVAAVRTAGVADVRVGIADGGFAARIATQVALPLDAHVVPVGGAAEFLAPWPVRALGDPGLADLLTRLGLRTVGAFAELPDDAVLARFGPAGAHLHQLAQGADYAPGVLTTSPPDMVERYEFDPPAERVDVAAFAGKALADRLLQRCADHGLACTRVVIAAETEHGERMTRVWRASEPFTPGALAERVRWQLDAWLLAGNGGPRDADLADADITTSGITLLQLVPDEVVVAHGRQLGFWGGDAAAAERAARAFARVQGMLGPDAVVTPVEQGGRFPDERVEWVRFGDPRDAARPLVARAPDRTPPPWPGAIPGPAPARVVDAAANLLDDARSPVVVTGRGEASAPPEWLECDVVPGGGGRVISWGGPWPHDARWWDPQSRRRGASWQLVVDTPAGHVACLVVVTRGRARVVALHD